MAEETIELKPVRRSKLGDSLSKLKAVTSSSKKGKKSEYNILLQGDFMLRLAGKKKKAKFRSKGIPINLKNLEIRMKINIQR